MGSRVGFMDRVRRGGRAAGMVAVCLAVPAAPAAAVQDRGVDGPARLAVIQGRVVETGTGRSLSGAGVTLRPREEGPAASELVAGFAVTDGTGSYRIVGIEAGRYDLTVERPGYRARTLVVTVGGGDPPRVSVALDVVPIELSPLKVEVAGRSRVVDAEGREVTVGRVDAVLLRQRRFLSSDVRIVTAADVEEAVTLGEPDLFRALQRVPGVSTRDDFTAELWTRGADWGETRVYLDGIPLFNPVHGFGILSGVSSRLVASATLHPGVRPVEHPEGSAAVVDLRSRTGSGLAAPVGGVDVSLASAQAWGAGPIGEGGGWSAGVRRSWIDAVAEAIPSHRSDAVPYAFEDAHGHLTLSLGGGHRMAATLLVERDEIDGELPDLLHNTLASWGNVGGALAVEGPLGTGLRYRQSLGATAYGAEVRRFAGAADSSFSAPSEQPADHAVRYFVLGGQISSATAPDRWTIGYDLVRQSARYAGPETWPYSTTPPDLPQVADTAVLSRIGIWARGRWAATDRIDVETGLRVDGGSRTAAGRLEIMPNALVRFRPKEPVSVSVGAGRYVQYAQSPAPVGPRVQRVLQTGRRWILADNRRAPVRADIATLGAEAWLTPGWLVGATAYARWSSGLLLPDPTPGLLVQRPPLVAGETRAEGLELSLRRLAGRVTGSLSWSLSRARAHVAGRTVPAPTDRTHLVDASSAIRLGSRSRLGMAFTYASGAPYARVLPCGDEECRGVILDAPFSRRGPAYASLDLAYDQSHDFGGWSLGWFVQVRNVFGMDNRVTYVDTNLLCPGNLQSDPCPGGTAPRPVDEFATGIPTIPLLGLRVAF
ncbi:MAG: TonB-dependent receptor [Gemmatimonadota bacterium]